jgi:hypothetical protein
MDAVVFVCVCVCVCVQMIVHNGAILSGVTPLLWVSRPSCECCTVLSQISNRTCSIIVCHGIQASVARKARKRHVTDVRSLLRSVT